MSFGAYYGNETRECVFFLDGKTILFPHYIYFIAFLHLPKANFPKIFMLFGQYMKNNLYFCLEIQLACMGEWVDNGICGCRCAEVRGSLILMVLM